MIKHSVSRWCFDSTPLDILCEKYHQLGISALDLLMLNEIPEAQKLGLDCAITRAIKDTGFSGYIGQEYVPSTKNPFKFLPEAIKQCS